MDNAELRKIIDQYVDDRYYDKDKLLQYLSMHQMVGTEIFDYVDKKSLPGGKQAHSRYLDSDSGYYRDEDILFFFCFQVMTFIYIIENLCTHHLVH